MQIKIVLRPETGLKIELRACNAQSNTVSPLLRATFLLPTLIFPNFAQSNTVLRTGNGAETQESSIDGLNRVWKSDFSHICSEQNLLIWVKLLIRSLLRVKIPEESTLTTERAFRTAIDPIMEPISCSEHVQSSDYSEQQSPRSLLKRFAQSNFLPDNVHFHPDIAQSNILISIKSPPGLTRRACEHSFTGFNRRQSITD